ncbi:MAG: LLM class F420-dependent oxidoreductase [bacterium]|nr:LLM class F420-dependent oxidoreductase [Gammaproteobacteria bacterium]HIL98735.1 LLM class F420-dependent oxidoreductase [Pseudomonadales bacterium]
MKIGVVFPQTEIGADPATIAEFAVTTESLGYDHLLAYDHVLGANTASRPDWQGPYTTESMFQEPLVLFSYLAGLTKSIELVTGVIILPQRQTALVAKQAACVDVISGGRLRLGVGTGWNDVEYQALGEDFKNRGVRCEEQIELLRQLWRDEAITFEGQWHKVTDAGLNPLPLQRNIPIWLGGMAPKVIDRVGRIADGWFPFANKELANQIQQMHECAKQAGRDPASIGVECIVPADTHVDRLKLLQEQGVTHFALVTMNQELASPQAHIDAISEARDKLDILF